jgi:hypothetical protein
MMLQTSGYKHRDTDKHHAGASAYSERGRNSLEPDETRCHFLCLPRYQSKQLVANFCPAQKRNTLPETCLGRSLSGKIQPLVLHVVLPVQRSSAAVGGQNVMRAFGTMSDRIDPSRHLVACKTLPAELTLTLCAYRIND